MNCPTSSSHRSSLPQLPSLPPLFSPWHVSFLSTKDGRLSVSSPRLRAPEPCPTRSPSEASRSGASDQGLDLDMIERKAPVEAIELNDTHITFKSRHPAFDELLGSAPRLRLLLRDPQGRPLFHEAGIYHASTKSVYLSTNRLPTSDGRPTGHRQMAGIVRVDLTKLSDASIVTPCPALEDVEAIVDLCQTLPPGLAMPNGATLWKQGEEQAVLWCEQGRHLVDSNSEAALADVHAALVSFVPTKPEALASATTTVLLDSYKGKRFSSLNDVVVHEQSGVVFFTDPDYGVEQNFKRSHEEEVYAPNALYAWYPPTGEVRLIDDRYDKPNGVTFVPSPTSPHAGTGLLCTTDTGAYTFVRDSPLGTFKLDPSRPLSIYTYSVEPAKDPSADPFPRVAVEGRRLLAHSECGAPDGVHPDEKGNLWVGSGDGVHIYNPWFSADATCPPLIGKIVLPTGKGVANFCWAGPIERSSGQPDTNGDPCHCRLDSVGEAEDEETDRREENEQEDRQYRLLLFAEDELWELGVGVNGRD